MDDSSKGPLQTALLGTTPPILSVMLATFPIKEGLMRIPIWCCTVTLNSSLPGFFGRYLYQELTRIFLFFDDAQRPMHRFASGSLWHHFSTSGGICPLATSGNKSRSHVLTDPPTWMVVCRCHNRKIRTYGGLSEKNSG